MLKVKKRPVKKHTKQDLQISATVAVYDVPVSLIDLSPDNPNEQDDKTFDQLVERIKTEGFDEPVHIMPTKGGRYMMVSGEHRFKAASYLKFKTIPAVIHKDWDNTKREIELVARNMLRGNLNPEKFTKLYDKLKKKGLDGELIKAQMGFTKADAFEKVYQNIEKSVSPRQKQKLQQAKEKIKSVDDLSSVLNTIFKEHGSELDHGFMVFSFGGKNHHYIPTDKELDKLLIALEDKCMSEGKNISDIFRSLLSKSGVKSEIKGKLRKRKPKHETQTKA